MSDALSDEELALIEARVQAATEGSWRAFVEGRDHLSGDNFIRVGGVGDEEADMYVTLSYGTRNVPASVSDLEFIAAARQDVSRLIEEVRRLGGPRSPRP